jgi:hypothetical protein
MFFHFVVACAWGEWSEWTPCSPSCSVSFSLQQMRNKTSLYEFTNCTSTPEEFRKCPWNPCPSDIWIAVAVTSGAITIIALVCAVVKIRQNNLLSSHASCM